MTILMYVTASFSVNVAHIQDINYSRLGDTENTTPILTEKGSTMLYEIRIETSIATSRST